VSALFNKPVSLLDDYCHFAHKHRHKLVKNKENHNWEAKLEPKHLSLNPQTLDFVKSEVFVKVKNLNFM
jgi:hypothetical protein